MRTKLMLSVTAGLAVILSQGVSHQALAAGAALVLVDRSAAATGRASKPATPVPTPINSNDRNALLLDFVPMALSSSLSLASGIRPFILR